MCVKTGIKAARSFRRAKIADGLLRWNIACHFECNGRETGGIDHRQRLGLAQSRRGAL